MASSGEVSRETVLGVLAAHGVGVSRQEGRGDAQSFTFAKDGVVLSVVLYKYVGRRILHSLQWKLGIPIHHFYHPEMAPLPPGTAVN